MVFGSVSVTVEYWLQLWFGEVIPPRSRSCFTILWLGVLTAYWTARYF